MRNRSGNGTASDRLERQQKPTRRRVASGIKADSRAGRLEAAGGASTTVWYLGPTAYDVDAAAVSGGKRKFVKAGPSGAGGL
ncbi:MAG: hypothetical protein Q8R82_09205 [Hyphomonadaceae bacterium]|nr:hypothetical protein [Hyphomonadaceae bacterium]